MQIESSRFGSIEVPENGVIHFPRGASLRMGGLQNHYISDVRGSPHPGWC